MVTTLDNASNNNVMVVRLERKLPNTFKGTDAHGNCFTHILNLVAKAIVSPFDRKAAAAALEDDDDYELPDYGEDEGDEESEDEDNADFSEILSALDEEEEDDDDSEDTQTLKEQAAEIALVLAKV